MELPLFFSPITSYGRHKFEEDRYWIHVTGIVFDTTRRTIVSQGVNDKGYFVTKLMTSNHLNKRPQCTARVHVLIGMHFLPPPDDPAKTLVDHIDRVNNHTWLSNLRWITHAGNAENRSSAKNSSSRFVGVAWHKSVNKWKSHIKHAGKKKHIGCYETEELAAHARDEYVKKHFPHRNFTLNFPPPPPSPPPQKQKLSLRFAPEPKCYISLRYKTPPIACAVTA